MDDILRDAARLRQIIRENGFAELEDYLMQYARPSIRLYTTRTNEDQIPLGQSKIGGRPDLPPHLDWARVPDRYGELVSLSFIAQINLSEVKPYDVENWLPEKGILYFFTASLQDSKNVDYQHNACVLYFDGDISTLERREFPDDLTTIEFSEEWALFGERFYSCHLQVIPEVNLPMVDANWQDPTEFPAGKTDDDFMHLQYLAGYTRPLALHKTVHRLLGYNFDIPHDMQLDCELIVHEGTPFKYDELEQYQATKGQWQLLLQIDSDDEANMIWSDMGVICFYIRQDDLRHKRFDQAVVTMFTA